MYERSQCRNAFSYKLGLSTNIDFIVITFSFFGVGGGVSISRAAHLYQPKAQSKYAIWENDTSYHLFYMNFLWIQLFE